MSMNIRELQVNFFEVPLPGGPISLFARELAEGDGLREGERLWTEPIEERKLAVLIVQPAQGLAGYEPMSYTLSQMTQGLVKVLLSSGLQTALASKGRIVEASHTDFSCFCPNDIVTTDVPDFILMRTGVRFTPDCAYVQRRSHFGFFVSWKVRMHFQRDLRDAALAEAATNQRVRFRSGYLDKPATLISSDAATAQALIILDDKETTTAFENVLVPASPKILDNYCRRIGRPDIATRLRLRAQVEACRLKDNGQKDRRSFVRETEKVRAWLNAASSGGRISLSIPNSGQEVYVDVRPSTAEIRAL